jgi:hypothetical protein
MECRILVLESRIQVPKTGSEGRVGGVFGRVDVKLRGYLHLFHSNLLMMFCKAWSIMQPSKNPV